MDVTRGGRLYGKREMGGQENTFAHGINGDISLSSKLGFGWCVCSLRGVLVGVLFVLGSVTSICFLIFYVLDNFSVR